jgi:hypothetical protein
MFQNTRYSIYRVFIKELSNGVSNATALRVLRKRLDLNAYKLSIIQGVERCIVCTTLSVNVFMTYATPQHLEYHSKALCETPCVTSEQ